MQRSVTEVIAESRELSGSSASKKLEGPEKCLELFMDRMRSLF